MTPLLLFSSVTQNADINTHMHMHTQNALENNLYHYHRKSATHLQGYQEKEDQVQTFHLHVYVLLFIYFASTVLLMFPLPFA